jgi:hypothetical protein
MPSPLSARSSISASSSVLERLWTLARRVCLGPRKGLSSEPSSSGIRALLSVKIGIASWLSPEVSKRSKPREDWPRPELFILRGVGMTSFGEYDWKLRMRAVLVMLAALRFLRDLLGVGRMDCGVGRCRRGVLSESLSTSANARLTGVLRGVL